MKVLFRFLSAFALLAVATAAWANGNSPLAGFSPSGPTACMSVATTNTHHGSVQETCVPTAGSYNVWEVPLQGVPAGAHTVDVQVVGPPSFYPAMNCWVISYNSVGSVYSAPAQVEIPEGVSGVQTVSLGSVTWPTNGTGSVFCAFTGVTVSGAGQELISITY